MIVNIILTMVFIIYYMLTVRVAANTSIVNIAVHSVSPTSLPETVCKGGKVFLKALDLIGDWTELMPQPHLLLVM